MALLEREGCTADHPCPEVGHDSTVAPTCRTGVAWIRDRWLHHPHPDPVCGCTCGDWLSLRMVERLVYPAGDRRIGDVMAACERRRGGDPEDTTIAAYRAGPDIFATFVTLVGDPASDLGTEAALDAARALTGR